MENKSLNQAILELKAGNPVCFPTETVYGIGADASSEAACLKIFNIKKRPLINPLIIHISSTFMAEKLAYFNADALILVEKFWPGPLSIVLNKKPNANISRVATASLETIALRMPAHKIALELIDKFQAPLAAPSANPSEYISPTETKHVSDDFKEQIFILEGERSKIGIESTIIDLSGEEPLLLRAGSITKEELELVLKKEIKYKSENALIKAPGMLYKHYAPKANLRINATKLHPGEIGLNFGASFLKGYCLNLSENGDLKEAAYNLFFMLRELDNYAKKHQVETIAVAPIPSIDIGVAINDKLNRASKK